MRFIGRLAALWLVLVSPAVAAEKTVQPPILALPAPAAPLARNLPAAAASASKAAAPAAVPSAAKPASTLGALSVQTAAVERAAQADASGAGAAKAVDAIYAERKGEDAGAVSAQPAAEEPLGARTLSLLDRFLGGKKAADRDEGFLYAEGAKVLPDGLEKARWGQPRRRDRETERGVLLRRDGRAYIQTYDEEGNTSRPIPVGRELAEGIPSETFVDVTLAEPSGKGRGRGDRRDRRGRGRGRDGNDRFDRARDQEQRSQKRPEKEVVYIRPVASLPADVVVGRVQSRNGQLYLDSLLTDHGRPTGLYKPMPLTKGAFAAADGDIVQAFVRPLRDQQQEAIPLVSLGRKLTPAVAARDISLRYGARGYFDEAVIKQAEDLSRTADAVKAFEQLKAKGARVQDMRSAPFMTIDPPGAADLDDADYLTQETDGSYTWYLATALVAPYVQPGSPAFKYAMRAGNTLYSTDKEGVGAYPMNHPVVSMNAASLLTGKDSLAMITKMRFAADGTFLMNESDIFLGLMRSKGRYTYDQVEDFYRSGKSDEIKETDQLTMGRALVAKLFDIDVARGKLELNARREDPIKREAHRFIEKSKVYVNLVIQDRLKKIRAKYKIPILGREHPPKDEKADLRLAAELEQLGLQWDPAAEPLSDFIVRLEGRKDVDDATKETALGSALRSRSRARYTTDDKGGHEGLAYAADEYGHPSTPIRRAGDMYHNNLLYADLQGDNPRQVYDTMMNSLRGMGFSDLADYAKHLNARQEAGKRMKREMEDFNDLYELAKPELKGKTLAAFVKATPRAMRGQPPSVVIHLRDSGIEFRYKGPDAGDLALRDDIWVTVRGVDLGRLEADVEIEPMAGRGR